MSPTRQPSTQEGWLPSNPGTEDAEGQSSTGLMTRLLLLLLPALVTLNPVLPSVGPLPGYVIAAVMLLLSSLTQLRTEKSTGAFRPLVWVWSMLVLVQVTVAFVASSETPSVRNESIVVGFGVSLILSVVTLSSKEQALKHLLRGWLIAFLLTGGIGAYELLTGVRLVPSYLDANPLAQDIGIASTFYNANNYAAFLVVAAPFLAIGVRSGSTRIERILHLLSLLGAIPLILGTGSRFGVALGLVLALVAVLVNVSRKAFAATIGLVLVILLIVYTSGGSFDDPTFFGDGLFAIPVFGNEILVDPSLYIRWNLALNGLGFLAGSTLLGIGAGRFEYYMLRGDAEYDTLGIVNPHNGVVELLAQYGLLTFGIFVLINVLALSGALRARQRPDSHSFRRGAVTAVISSIVTIPIVGLMHSSYLDSPYVWVGFATTFGLALYLAPARE